MQLSSLKVINAILSKCRKAALHICYIRTLKDMSWSKFKKLNKLKKYAEKCSTYAFLLQVLKVFDITYLECGTGSVVDIG